MKRPLHRMTDQRRVILAVVTEKAGHWSADEVFMHVRRSLPNISLATVYRNLEVLASMGFITKLDLAGNQKRFDGNPDTHYHIRCVSCGRLADVPHDAVTSFNYRHDAFDGFGGVSASVSFNGICENCRRIQEKEDICTKPDSEVHDLDGLA